MEKANRKQNNDQHGAGGTFPTPRPGVENMIMSYDTEVAKICGANAATVFYSICYWIYRNQKNDTNFRDGKYWTYNSKKGWSTYFPHLNERQVKFSLEKLIELGLIETANYNANPMDQTLWYAITTKGAQYFCEIDRTKLSNREATRAREYCTLDINTDKSTEEGKRREEDGAIDNKNKYPANPEEVIKAAADRAYLMSLSEAANFMASYGAVGWKTRDNRPIENWRYLLDKWKTGQTGEQYRQAVEEHRRRELGLTPGGSDDYVTLANGEKWPKSEAVYLDEFDEWVKASGAV